MDDVHIVSCEGAGVLAGATYSRRLKIVPFLRYAGFVAWVKKGCE